MTSAEAQLPAAQVSPEKSPRSSIWLIAVCIVATSVKFWLIRNDEIVAAHSVLDGLWYLTSAKFWYWDRAYDYLAFVRLPGYPLWVAAVHSLGVPLRLMGEALLLGSAFVFVMTAVKIGLPRLVAGLMFVAIAFHPSGFVVFNHPTPDTLYAPLLLLALAATMRSIFETDWRCRAIFALFSGLSLGWMWITREESPLIVVYLISLAVAALFVRPKLGARQIAMIVLLPVVPIVPIVLGVCALNYASFGLFTTSEFTADGFLAANRALMRIKPAEPKHITPVTLEVRQAAYKVSPAFNELQPYLEGQVDFDRSTLSQDQFGQMKEIPSGGWVWFLREAARLAGHHTSARDANAYYQKIADEINAACDNGKLPSRFTVSAMIDASFGVWLPQIPNSILRQARAFGRTKPREVTEQPRRSASPGDIAIFDDMTSRRSKLVHEGSVTISGWAFDVTGDPLVAAQIVGPEGVIGKTDQFYARPDVAAAFPKIPNVPVNSGFSLTAPLSNTAPRNADLVFVRRSGATIKLKIDIADNGETDVETAEESILRMYVDDAKSSALPSQIENTIKGRLWPIYGWTVRILSGLGLVALGILVKFRRQIDLKDPAYAVVVLLAAVIGARFALFSCIDAMSGPTPTILRYMYPVTYLYTCVLLILIAGAVQVATSATRR